MKRVLLVLVSLTVLSGCELLGGGGGTGGGAGGGSGGGGGSITFSQGFTFVRKDDRNVYVADESDYSTVAVLSQSGDVRTPSFSKNGSRIVFVRGTGMTAEIATVSAQGGAISTVLASTAQASNFKTPVFSPDGARIAFSYDDAMSTSIGLVNADGTGFQKLIGGSSLAYASPSFSPDGAFVVAAAGNVGLALTQVERINVATGMPTSITNTLGNEAQGIAGRLVLSPDGTRAAFDGRISTGVTRIFVLDLATRAVVKVNEYPGDPNANDSFPCWISAAMLAFSSDSGGNDSVYQKRADGSGGVTLLVPKAIEPWYGSSL
ncbi:MAG: LpqB family beta-propeller domain-containing protein [Myxococcota bacterium]